jgi:ubiquinone/menaquinone biosynthesis C-methylase UbiE
MAYGQRVPARHPVSGRVIAPVMSAAGADWLERSERESEESPTKAVAQLGLKPGMTVCDLGAGTGYYAVRMARLVGGTGKVYAVDIQPKMLELLGKRLASAGINNIEPVLGAEAETNLPADSQDLIILVDVYHEFSKPQEMLRSIRKSLKADGRLVLLEFRKEDTSVPIRLEHKMSLAEVKAETEPEGFVIDKVVDKLPWQHMIFLRKK